MQYMLLCCIDEGAWTGLATAERDQVMKEYDAFVQGIVKSGHYRAGGRLDGVATATTVRVRNGQAGHHRRAVRGDQGAARRLLPDRVPRPRRGARDRARGSPRARGRRGRGAAVRCRAVASARDDRRQSSASSARVRPDPRDADPRRAATSTSPRRRCRRRSPRRWSSGRSEGPPRNPGAWLITRGAQQGDRPLRARERWPRREKTRASLPSVDAPQDGDDAPVPRRSAAPDLHLLPPGARAGGAGGAHAAHAVRPLHRGDRARVPGAARRRWRSGWCARSARSARRASRTRSRPTTRCRSASTRCWRSSTSSSTRATRRAPATTWSAATCARGDPARRACCASCCPTSARREGLLALMLLHDARRDARVDAERRAGAARGAGPRRAGTATQIAEGLALVEARAARRPARRVRAAGGDRRAARRRARGAADTDWRQIAALYGVLRGMHPSPVVELNRAVAVAMADGPRARAGAARAPGRCRATTCFRRRAPTCCAGSAASPRPPAPTARRSRWSPTTPSGASSQRRLAEVSRSIH